MDFKKYNSIENSYRKKFLDKIVEEGHSKEEYAVEEKIHGANFSFWANGTKIECAKRSGFVKEGEKFYNFQDVKKEYYSNVQAMQAYLQGKGFSELAIYGELYGGSYPHPDVPKGQQSCVQKHVYYSPKQDFIAFDIKVDGLYLPLDEVHELCEMFAIPYCKTLFRGSLEDCLEYQNTYPTTLPALAGLPEIEGNTCEGNVIRPVNPIFLWSGERLIIKNKNQAFSEKHGVTKTKERKPPKQLDPHIVEAIDTASQYINENRLRNVISKIGDVTQKDFGKIMGAFTQDIIEDYRKDEDVAFQALDKKDRQLITKNIGQKAAHLLRQNFVNIVDGEF